MNFNNNRPLIDQIAKQLAAVLSDPVNCEQEARWLMQFVLQKPLVHPNFFLLENQQLSPLQLDLLNALLKRRIEQHEPLAYILGNVPFAELEIKVVPPILIPRPETEEWCLNLIEQLKSDQDKALTIVDLCTGSGCIALALAKTLPNSRVIGVDINPAAIELARQNAALNRLQNVEFLEADVLQTLSLPDKIDIITANPPYISKDDWQQLLAEVKNWEDENALVANNHGLEFYQVIARLAQEKLSIDQGVGCCVVEIGHTQGAEVSAIFEQQGFVAPTVQLDLFGQPRTVWVKK